MKHLAYILLAVTLTFLSCKSTDKDNSNALSTDLIDNEHPPVIEFDSEEFDFGTIAQGQSVYHVFNIKNIGESELILNDVKPTCGCTVPKNWPKQPIAPGESAEIEVQYDGSGTGLVKKLITVTSNAKPAFNKLYLRGKVVGPE